MVGGVALALVGAGSAASLGLSTPGDPCAADQRSMDELWAEQGREQLRHALCELAAIDLAEGQPRRALERLDTLGAPPTDAGLDAEIALTRALALLARDEPGDFEQARALRAQIETSRDERGIPEPPQVERLIQRLAAHETSRGPAHSERDAPRAVR